MVVKIRQLQSNEVADFWKLAFSDADAGWTKLNGPYFHDDLPTKDYFEKVLAKKYWLNNKNRLVITFDGTIVGSVGASFKDNDLKRWLDVGITIYPEEMWDKHIGTQALKLFFDYLFKIYNLPHLSLTTWSGNSRMMHLAEKIGMRQEACIRSVRYYNGKYYDSVVYGILRSEWMNRK